MKISGASHNWTLSSDIFCIIFQNGEKTTKIGEGKRFEGNHASTGKAGGRGPHSPNMYGHRSERERASDRGRRGKHG